MPTHKQMLASARQSEFTQPAVMTSRRVYETRVWTYRIKVNFYGWAPPPFKDTERLAGPLRWFHMLCVDNYEGVPVMWGTDYVGRAKDGGWLFDLHRSAEEEYIDDEKWTLDDDAECIVQLIREFEPAVDRMNGIMNIAVLDRTNKQDTRKEIVKAKEQEVGERLTSLITKYFGTDYDYAQFGAAVLDEIEAIINEEENTHE